MVHADDQSHIALARQVVVFSGAAADLREMYPKMLAQVRPAFERQGIPRETVDGILKKFAGKQEHVVGVYVDSLAQVYVREFSEEDLKSVIAFYQSPIGQLVIAKQPVIRDAMATVGAQLGQQVADEVLRELVAETLSSAKPR